LYRPARERHRAQGASRAVSRGAVLEIELTRCNTPFVKFGGLKFLEPAPAPLQAAPIAFTLGINRPPICYID